MRYIIYLLAVVISCAFYHRDYQRILAWQVPSTKICFKTFTGKVGFDAARAAHLLIGINIF